MSDHHHTNEITDLNTRFVAGILLNLGFVIVEGVSGFYYNSLALLSDAGHNLSDVASLLLALLAFKLAKIKPNYKFTYGYKKTTVLVALLNAVILFLAMGGIIRESFERLQTPAVTSGNPIVIVASIGIIINALTAWLFAKNIENDLNIRSVYLNMLADTLVSCGVVIAGLLMIYTGWYWLDAFISILIAIVILISSFNLLKSSFHLSIDAVPEGIDIKQIKEEIEKIDEVLQVHHIHVWAISTTLNAFTGHIKIHNKLEWEEIMRIKKSIRHALSHQNIHHSTIEFDTEEDSDKDENY
ncbi:MAG: cation transporter [Leptospiraceae bacterium]|nr:cation transporter [Leptospiraceae bacterium]